MLVKKNAVVLRKADCSSDSKACQTLFMATLGDHLATGLAVDIRNAENQKLPGNNPRWLT